MIQLIFIKKLLKPKRKYYKVSKKFKYTIFCNNTHGFIRNAIGAKYHFFQAIFKKIMIKIFILGFIKKINKMYYDIPKQY
jgi:hypothetical protein